MSTINTVRAWKDEDYRLGLSQADRDLLPEHPAGLTDLSDDELSQFNGGCIMPTLSTHLPTTIIVTRNPHKTIVY